MSENTRINKIDALMKPSTLKNLIPITDENIGFINYTREEIHNILNKTDDRLIIIVGPCSIHDTKSALHYAKLLSELSNEVKNNLLIVMRTYFEKPRTCIGWKGLINDPNLNGSFDMTSGLKTARQLLVDICSTYSLPVSTEFLDPISPQFLSDLISWGAIGARTTESQVHRQLSSGLSCAIGFKNGTSGNVEVAIQGCKSAKYPHTFLGMTEEGLSAIIHTKGNDDCHIILRGGVTGPNYFSDQVEKCVSKHVELDMKPRIMIDCSHGNSRKDHRNQHLVVEEIIKQVKEAKHKNDIIGLMIESNIHEGKQKLCNPSNLQYGVSITDACINWNETKELILKLSSAVEYRRKLNNGFVLKQ